MSLRLNKLGILYILLTITLILTACNSSQPRFIIGVSQCSSDIWRNKLIDELRTANYSRDDVQLCFVSANDDDQRQIAQIDSLISIGVDLLIVSPNQVSTISPAIDRAYQKGIKVILFDRKTDSPNYTAFMGADNYAVGHAIGEYIANRLGGHGRVLEIMGLRGSSPAIERHKGFADAMKAYPSIDIVATLQGDWTEESAYNVVKQNINNLLGTGQTSFKDSPIDFVFGQNDRMAMGARKALSEHATRWKDKRHFPLFCGIDGLPGEEGGLQLVRDSLLDATYIYPTHGDRLLQLALDILDGKPYEKEVRLMSALITRNNANLLLMQNEEVERQTSYIDDLHKKSDTYLQQLSNQRMITLLSAGIILLLALAAFLIWRDRQTRIRINKERENMSRQQIDFYTQAAHQLRTPLTLITGPLKQLGQTAALQQNTGEAHTMYDIVSRNVEQLSEQVNKILNVSAPATLDKDEDRSLIESIITPTSSEKQDDDTPLSILVVDDNADIRTYLRTILAPRYTISEAPDGKQGLELAQRDVPDLIVSDVMMPVMNGLEFCQQVKENIATSHIPVILLTARALSQHQIEGYRSGADAYITKPFDAQLLLVRIENLLRSRRALRNLWTTFTNIPGQDEKQQLQSTDSSLDTNGLDKTLVTEAPFITNFKKIVEERMSDSELSIEDIGSDIGLSRVQLYRKVKALTGHSPVELIRTARLEKARQMLQSTDMTISEVAYSVGFSAPSYFTKCFRDEFGISPSELGS